MIALSRGELATSTRAVIKHFKRDPRSFGRRARQRHAKTSRIHETRRNARDPALRPIMTSLRRSRDAPATRQFTTYSSAAAAHVSLSMSSTRRWQLAFAIGDNTIVTSAISITQPEIHILVTPWRVAVKCVNVLTRASTTASSNSSSELCWNHSWHPRPGCGCCC